MNPYDEAIYNEEGVAVTKKVYVLYVDGDEKLCDGCNKRKAGIASIRMVCGDFACICQECVQDILTVWDEPRALLLEKQK